MPGRHFVDNTVPRLLARHSPGRIAPAEKKSRPTKRCVLYTYRVKWPYNCECLFGNNVEGSIFLEELRNTRKHEDYMAESLATNLQNTKSKCQQLCRDLLFLFFAELNVHCYVIHENR